jgi:arylsulfatase A-like enzyme
MRPNVLFILVDGLRADQCYGVDKTSYTPFLDSLISSGVYFKNTFSSADGTHISLNCMLSSKSQFQTGIRAQKIILLEDNHLQKTKSNSSYSLIRY